MTLPKMQAVVARLLTDAAFQRGFFQADSGDSASYGLEPHEFHALRRIDAAHLGLVSEGYTGKRFERIESCFPKTLAILLFLRPDVRRHYLSHTPFPRDDAEERQTFQDYVSTNEGDLKEDQHRLLNDVASVELALYQLPAAATLASAIPSPSADHRPLPSRFVARVVLHGPLYDVWSRLPRPPTTYPPMRSQAVVGTRASSAFIKPLSMNDQEIVDACDGTRTVAEIQRQFGPGSAIVVEGWLRDGLLEVDQREPRTT